MRPHSKQLLLHLFVKRRGFEHDRKNDHGQHGNNDGKHPSALYVNGKSAELAHTNWFVAMRNEYGFVDPETGETYRDEFAMDGGV